jgi:hypothetical protein
MRPLAECLSEYYNEDVAPALLSCVSFRAFVNVGPPTRGDLRCESHQTSRIAVQDSFVKLQFSFDPALGLPKVKFSFYGERKVPIAPDLYTHIETVGPQDSRARIFLIIFFPVSGLFEVSLHAPHTLWRGFFDATQESPVIPFLYAGSVETQVVPMWPLTRLTPVSNGPTVIRFAALKNFDIVRARIFFDESATSAVAWDLFVVPCACCSVREEVVAIAYFTEPGLYRVLFDFSSAGAVFASVPYFFDVTDSANECNAVIPAELDFPRVADSELGLLEPSASRIVTTEQSAEVAITVSPGAHPVVSLCGHRGLAPCSFKEKIDRGLEVTHTFALEFPEVGPYTLKVYINQVLAFAQQYTCIGNEIVSDARKEAQLQAELEARIEGLGESRLLTDIPDDVRRLVESWL